MRKVTFGAANSLDNYIARPDHGVDWLLWSDDAKAIMEDFWKGIDTVVMGRKTWEAAAAQGAGGQAMPGITTYVLSRTLTEAPEGAELVGGDGARFVLDLKRREGKDICVMGGGLLGASLLEVGAIDEIGFNIHPVILGAGIPLFHPLPRQVDLELVECRRLARDCVYLLYRVKEIAA